MPEPAKNINTVVSTNAKLNDTIETITRFVNDYSYQVADLAKDLQGKNDFETGKNIWIWVKQNIEYEADGLEYLKEGLDVEQVRTPARTIADKKGDCDCMTVLVCSLLKENNIKPYAKIVAYPEKDSLGNNKKNLIGNYKTKGFSHIYSFFYYKNNPVYIDTVPEISEYNQEAKEPIVKQKIIDIMYLEELKGIDTETIDYNSNKFNPDFLQEEQIFGRIVIKENPNGNKTGKEVVRAVIFGTLTSFKNSLIEDLKRPEQLRTYQEPEKEVNLLENVLNSKNQENLISNLEYAEENSNYSDLYFDILEELDTENLEGFENSNYSLELVEDENTRFEKRDETIGKLFDRKRRIERKTKRKSKRAEKKENRKESKFLNTAKKVTLAPARGAFLVLLKMNFRQMAEKLFFGEISQTQALEHGISDNSKFIESRKKFNETWEKFGGNLKDLDKAIEKSKAMKKLGLRGLEGLGVDPVTASIGTLIASATPIIVAFNKVFKGRDLPRKTGTKAVTKREERKEAREERKEAREERRDERNGIFDKAKSFVTDVVKKVTDKETTDNSTNKKTQDVEDIKPKASKKNNTLIFVAVGIAVVAIAVIIYFASQNKKLNGIAETEKRKRLNVQKRYRQLNGTKRRKPATKRKTTAVAKRKPATKRKTTAVAKRKPATKRKRTAKRK